MPHSSRSSRRDKGHSSDISFSHSKSLKFPRESSSPSSWARFCNDATVLTLGGYSIAVAIGEDISSSVSSAHSLAETLFTPAEADMYRTWKDGKSPPRADWRKLSTALSATTSAQRARWNDLTDALRVLYDDSKISKENCKAWTEKYTDVMPLLLATKKVEKSRHDARPAKAIGSSKSKYDVHEIIGCRKVISEIGKQRVRSNTTIKQLNKDADEREKDLNKRLARVNHDEPRDRDDAASKFLAREQYYSKLTKVRVERVQMNGEVARQNAEIDSSESALKDRIALLEDKLRRQK